MRSTTQNSSNNQAQSAIRRLSQTSLEKYEDPELQIKKAKEEFESSRAETYLVQKKKWKIQSNELIQSDLVDNIEPSLGAILSKRRYIRTWTYPCLKDCQSLWISDQHLSTFYQSDIYSIAECYENLNLGLLVILLRQISLLNCNSNQLETQKIDEIKKIEFKTSECYSCQTKCHENYEGTINLLLTESIVSSLKQDEMRSWITFVYQQFQARFQNIFLYLEIEYSN